ncbi:MAG: hypothetical protein HY769_03260 [Candidatus Stahlbacteria bacterium]|nr:hypothetical protein [Candidatus Stahlbacteria bacterium]
MNEKRQKTENGRQKTEENWEYSGTLRDKRVSVIGFGRSGKACVELLVKMGANVFVSEIDKRLSVSGNWLSQTENRPSNPDFEFGKHSDRIYEAGLIVISPGISMQHPVVREAKKRGIPVIGEIELGYRLSVIGCRKPNTADRRPQIIGVTGTNGKTTTCYLIQHLLESSGINAIACGNMGLPMSSVVSSNKSETLVVEISTFQLESIESFRPFIGVLLNITPDHLDRHKDFAEYRDLKFRMFSNQLPDDFAVLNFDDPAIRNQISNPKSQTTGQGTCCYPCTGTKSQIPNSKSQIPNNRSGDLLLPVYPNSKSQIPKLRSQKLFFSLSEPATVWLKEGDIFYGENKLCSIRELNIEWDCLLQNYLASIVVGKILKLSDSQIVNGLRTFKGVPHRLEEVGMINGIRFVNNSMCTNPAAFASTLNSCKTPVILIVGGKKKNVDITPIVETINNKARYVVLIGETSEELNKLVKVNRSIASSMDEAVVIAYNEASEGDKVLLLPGFASFDWFKDFSDRGNKFKDAVNRLSIKMKAER